MADDATECGEDDCFKLAVYRARFKSEDWSESPESCLRFCEKHRANYKKWKELHGDNLGPVEILGEREKEILEKYQSSRKRK